MSIDSGLATMTTSSTQGQCSRVNTRMPAPSRVLLPSHTKPLQENQTSSCESYESRDVYRIQVTK